MSEPIGPGDWVECIDDSPPFLSRAAKTRLVLGALYCVATVGPTRWSDGRVDDTDISLVLTHPATHWTAWDGSLGGWKISRFRPIRDGQERIVKKERVSA